MKPVPDRVKGLFAYMRERYLILQRRKAGKPFPWTDDPILQKHHFCNVFRRDDRTSIVIQSMMQQPTLGERLRVTVAGRHTNRWETTGDVITAALKHRRPALLNALSQPTIFNPMAYKVRTKRGLWNRDDVADMILAPMDKVADRLSDCMSMKQAYNCGLQLTNSEFILYQILLDLRDFGFFPAGFDDSDWWFMASGCKRGGLYLLGEYDYLDVPVGTDDSGPTNNQRIWIDALITRLVQKHGVSRQWLPSWPELGVHEIEFNLCEYDKYQRYRLVSPTNRRNRIYRPKELMDASQAQSLLPGRQSAKAR